MITQLYGIARIGGGWAVPLAPALAALACGTATPAQTFLPIPESETTAVLSGPLCEGMTSCTCQSQPGEAGLPENALEKRFEFKLGPVDNELWGMVDGSTLFKDREQAARCFYIDLRPGRHSVVLRARGDNGMGARLHVSEQSAKGAYDTFDFACGGPGVCSIDRLDEWEAELARYKRNLHDPCGSTKIRDLSWKAGEVLDRRHPTELEVTFELEIYDFVPKHGPGDPKCKDRY